MRSALKLPLAKDCSCPSSTPEEARTSGGHAIHCCRCWIERPLHDGPLPLVVNNWPALEDPKRMLDWLVQSPGSCRSPDVCLERQQTSVASDRTYEGAGRARGRSRVVGLISGSWPDHSSP